MNSLMHNNGAEWDDDILTDLFNARDRQLIYQIPLSTRTKADSWYWIFDSNGAFSVKSCYRRLQGENECTEKSFWKKLWSLQLPGKVINFLWRVCRNVLPTAEALMHKHVNVQNICSWCQLQNEDTLHVLFKYEFAKEVWQSMGLQTLLRGRENDTVLQIFKHVFTVGNKEQWVRFGLVCWGLWIRRNSWIWNRRSMTTFGVTAMVNNLLQDWERSRKPYSSNTLGIQPRKWCKPPQGWIKINIDAAYRQDMEYIGTGCIVRDEQGLFLRGRVNRLRRCGEAREAEAMSLKEALLWMKQWRTTRCIFEMDAKSVVDAVHGAQQNSIFHLIIDECVQILKHFEEVLVIFDHRSANKAAHMLAQAAYSVSGPVEWCNAAPEFICNLVEEEK